MSDIPRLATLDSAPALLREGYPFISSRCAELDSDVFRTRLMGRQAFCVMGEDAARMFYEPGRMTRRGALPPTALASLQDFGSVATLDGAEHRRRKQMFLEILDPGAVGRLASCFEELWRDEVARWERMDQVVLFDEVSLLLCRAVCRWAGVPIDRSTARRRTHELLAMIDGAGAVGPRNWRGLLLRARTERWARGLIAAVRAGEVQAPDDSALTTIAWHRDTEGQLLDTKIAAVELVNVVRPVVAVARYVAFAALALHEHPEACPAKGASDTDIDAFTHEVRRFYPFFPAVAGRALHPFEWRGHTFSRGAWFLLDLYGTNRDGRVWESPATFDPARFSDWDGNAFALVPQGGGDFGTGHRCAGEWMTIGLLRAAYRALTESMRYDVPEQDLRVDLSRLPTLPATGFVLTDVRRP